MLYRVLFVLMPPCTADTAADTCHLFHVAVDGEDRREGDRVRRAICVSRVSLHSKVKAAKANDNLVSVSLRSHRHGLLSDDPSCTGTDENLQPTLQPSATRQFFPAGQHPSVLRIIQHDGSVRIYRCAIWYLEKSAGERDGVSEERVDFRFARRCQVWQGLPCRGRFASPFLVCTTDHLQ